MILNLIIMMTLCGVVPRYDIYKYKYKYKNIYHYLTYRMENILSDISIPVIRTLIELAKSECTKD